MCFIYQILHDVACAIFLTPYAFIHPHGQQGILGEMKILSEAEWGKGRKGIALLCQLGKHCL